MAMKALSIVVAATVLAGCDAAVNVSNEDTCVNYAAAFMAVSVADIEPARAWYARVFDLPSERNIDLGERGAIAILSNDCVTVELLSMSGSIDTTTYLSESASRATVQGIFKTGVFVADIDAAHARLTALGVDIDEQVLEDEAGLRFFNARDPAGNIIQHFQRPTRDRE